MMALFFDNQLDRDWYERDEVGSYQPFDRWSNGASGSPVTLKWFAPSGYMGKNIRLWISAGSNVPSGESPILRLTPAERDLAPGQQFNFMRVTPGREVRLSVDVGKSGSPDGWGNFAVSLSLYCVDANGTYITGTKENSTLVNPPHFTSGGVNLSINYTPPASAAFAYANLNINSDGGTLLSDGAMALYISNMYFGDLNPAPKGGVMEVGAATDSRLGIVADIYSRSQEKIKLELAGVDRELIAGERVELDAAALTAAETVWHWRQITGPAVEINQQGAFIDFIAPDVDDSTPVRIGVYAASEDGRNRSDWHYFDLTIQPPFLRLRDDADGTFAPSSPKYVGYDRGKREIWNDVIAPPTFVSNPRKEVEEIDLGILPDDVQFTDGEPPASAAAGGIYVDLNTGDYYLNFGAGYNETDDTTAAPRKNAWWVNPATGDILEWIED